MSILSNSHYEQITQSIALLKLQLIEASFEQQRQYEFIHAKLEVLLEQVKSNSYSQNKYQKEKIQKIEDFTNVAKKKLKQIRQKNQEKVISQELELQLKELYSCQQKLNKININLYSNLAQKIERQVDAVSEVLNEKSELHRQQIIEIEELLEKEIQQTSIQLNKNEEKNKSNELLQMLQKIDKEVGKSVDNLKIKRKQRKQKFLTLLETIIVKCKKSHEFDESDEYV